VGHDDDDEDTATIVASGQRGDEGMPGGTIVMGHETDAPTPVDPRLARMQAIAQAGLAPRRPAAGAGAPKPPAARQPVFDGTARPGADPERRVLPFPTPLPPAPDFDPMNRTVALMDDAPATSRFPAVPLPAPLPPEPAAALPMLAPEPPRVVVHPPPSSGVLAQTAVTPDRGGTPPIVVRFLIVCGVLTAVGLAALIYLVR
jgi:hypothetical protein